MTVNAAIKIWSAAVRRWENRYDHFPLRERVAIWRGVAAIFTCAVVIGVISIDMVAAQDRIQPSTPYEMQEHTEIFGQLKADEKDNNDLRSQFDRYKEQAEIRRSSRDAKEKAMDLDIQELKDRINAMQWMGIGASAIFSFIKAIGMLKKFSTADDSEEEAKAG